jgi:hypothetical protein
VEDAVNKIKNGKSSEGDITVNKMLKSGGPAVVEWLVRLFNFCMHIVVGAPFEWRSAIIIQLFKGKSEKKECKKYTGISLLSTPGKVYERVVIVSEKNNINTD